MLFLSELAGLVLARRQLLNPHMLLATRAKLLDHACENIGALSSEQLNLWPSDIAKALAQIPRSNVAGARGSPTGVLALRYSHCLVSSKSRLN